MQLQWNKCEGNVWCQLMSVNLNHAHFQGLEGVYVIWYNGPNGRYVRVGQGVIKDRLAAHRTDPAITGYGQQGTLYVSWAAVGAVSRDGVEAYLFDACKPLVGQRSPGVAPIQVNLPA